MYILVRRQNLFGESRYFCVYVIEVATPGNDPIPRDGYGSMMMPTMMRLRASPRRLFKKVHLRFLHSIYVVWME